MYSATTLFSGLALTGLAGTLDGSLSYSSNSCDGAAEKSCEVASCSKSKSNEPCLLSVNGLNVSLPSTINLLSS